MRFQTRTPAPWLAPFVSSIWYFEGEYDHTRERIIPNGEMQLLVNLATDELRSYHGDELSELRRIRGTSLSGVFGESFGIDTAEQKGILGVRFHPGGARPFFREPAHVARGQHIELADLWGRDGDVLRERLLEAPSPARRLELMETALTEAVVLPLERDRSVDYAITALDRGDAVRDVADAVGLSASTLKRRFAEHIGLTPKRFSRLRRFQHVLRAANETKPKWAELAHAHGYFDQAHLLRDFRQLAGIRPSQYRPRAPGDHNHIIVPPPASESAA